ncbi:MAG: exodeoxyribonuclease VII large subunit [Gammaproteobacteria bacterium]|nr:exodeoxyribonuclease VII large subunit [Gammaproteobacteria bacterium]
MSLINEDRTPLSISQLNNMVKDLLENNLPPLWVEGEISNFAKPASGHLYFSLKDSTCQVRSVMFRNRSMLLDFKPENGSQVLAKVRIGFYEARGEFQLIVDRLEEVGDGQLQQRFEHLKKKLASEGLFNAEHKQLLPELPQRIGVITSATGAAIRDVLSVLKRRFPAIPVIIYPVPVQGDNAAPLIAEMIRKAEQHALCDVLLLVRGGGSLEDLWAFNEEIVSRAIFACQLPIVSGVGHEVDITLADFSADVRAATPSAAAELVVPDQFSYQQSYDYYSERLQQLITTRLGRQQQQLNWLQTRLNQLHPQSRLAQHETRRLELTKRLLSHWGKLISLKKSDLKFSLMQLQQQSPRRLAAYRQQQLKQLIQQAKLGIQKQLQMRQQNLASSARTLHALSPLQTLSRGYAIVNKENSRENIVSSQQLQTDEIVKIRFDSGTVRSKVITIENDNTALLSDKE